MKWVWRILGAIAALLVVTVVTILVLLATTPGLSLARRIAVSLVPGLQLADARGSLYSTMEFSGLVFDHAIVTIRAEHVSIAWRPLALLHKTVDVDHAWVRGADVTVRVPQSKPDEPPSGPFSLPLRIVAHDVALAQSRVDVSDNGITLVHASDIDVIANGLLTGRLIDVEVERLHGYASTFERGGNLAVTGAVQMDFTAFIDGEAHIDLDRQGYAPLHVDARIARPIETSAVAVHVQTGASSVDVTGTLSVLDFTWPLIAAHVALHRADPHAFEALAPTLAIDGTVLAALRGPLFQADGEAFARVALHAPTYGGVALQHARVEASLHGLDVVLDTLDAAAFDATVRARGTARLHPVTLIPDVAHVLLDARSGGNVALPIPGHQMRVTATVHADATWSDAWVHAVDVEVNAPRFRFDDILVDSIVVRAHANGRQAHATVSASPEGGSSVEAKGQATFLRTGGFDPNKPIIASVQTHKFPLRYISRFAPDVHFPDGTVDIDASADDSVRATVTLDVHGQQRLAVSAEASVPLLRVIAAPLRAPITVEATVQETPLADLLSEWGIAPPAIEARAYADVTLAGSILRPQLSADVRLNGMRLLASATPHDVGVALEVKTADETVLNGRVRTDDKRVMNIDATIGIGMQDLLAGRSLLGRTLTTEITIVPTELTSLASFYATFEHMTGYAQGFVRATGTTDKPLLDADIKLVEATYAGIGLGTVALTAEASAERQTVSFTLSAPRFAGGSITGDGELALLDKTLSAKAALVHIDLTPFGGLLPRVRSLKGQLDASATVIGTLTDPQVSGQVQVSGASVDAWRLPPLHGIAIDAAIDRTGAHLSKLVMVTPDGGSVEATASMKLTHFAPSAITAHAVATKIPLPVRGIDDIRVTGTIDVDIPELVKGVVRLSAARVDVPTLQVPKTLGETKALDNVSFVGDVTASAPVAGAEAPITVPIDLKVVVGDTLVFGKDIDVTMASHLHVRSEGNAVALAGNVESNRGRVSVFDRAWDISRVALNFDGTTDVNPALDITLTRQFTEAFVTLRVQGTIRAPELVLTSTPALDRSQILSLVISGSSGSDRSDTGIGVAAAAVSAVLGGVATSLVRKVGLDVLRLQADKSTKVEVGKYIGERFYVAYRRQIIGSNTAGDTLNANELSVEYRLTDRLILQSAFGDAGTGGLDLMWTYRY